MDDAPATTARSAEPGTLSVIALAAGAVGNIVEWYDFGLYGLLAPILATLFFPAQDRAASLIGAYGAFAIGFAVRPLGGAVLGQLGDRVGRRFTLILSVVLMGCATTAIAFLPTYGSIGIAAPAALLLIRVAQGFSVGGEFTGSVAYLVESAPERRRGFAGSFANVGSTLGVLSGAGVAALTVTLAAPDDLARWAWRVPFLAGGLIALCGLFLRRRIPETYRAPVDSKRSAASPLRKAVREAPRTMLYVILFTSGYGVVNYLTMVFLPTYASEFGTTTVSRALQINTAAQALALVIVPISGWLSDRVSRRAILTTVFLAEAVFAVAGFTLAQHTAGLWLGQLAFGFLLALVMGTEPATLAGLFPPEYRLSGYSVSFNIGIGIAGGTAPIVATALIAATGNRMAPSWYLMFAGLVAAGAAFMMLRTRGDH